MQSTDERSNLLELNVSKQGVHMPYEYRLRRLVARLLSRSIRRDEEAAIIVITALIFPVLLAFLGLSLDFGRLYDLKRQQQQAVDAAVIGTVTHMWRGASNSEAIASGKNDAALNNFDDDDPDRVIDVSLTIDNARVIGVITEDEVPTFFMRILNWNEVSIQSRAVAGLVRYASGCLHALNPSSRGALKVSGNATIDSGCEVMVNSDHDRAITTNGGGCLSAGYVGTSGGYVSNGSATCIDPPPVTNVATAFDSLSYMQAMEPTPAAVPDYIDVSISGSDGIVTLSPGTYSGSLIQEQATDPITGDLLYDPLTGDPIMEVVGRNSAIRISGGEVRFEPGLYILDSGMRINADSVVRVVDQSGFVQTEPGTAGVTFYNTNTISPETSDYWDHFFIGGNADVKLYAPPDGLYQGLLFWEDAGAPDKQPGHVFAGTADAELVGTIYTPSSDVRWSGDNETTDWTMIIADEITLSGGAVLPGGNLNNSPVSPPVFAPTLLE